MRDSVILLHVFTVYSTNNLLSTYMLHIHISPYPQEAHRLKSPPDMHTYTYEDTFRQETINLPVRGNPYMHSENMHLVSWMGFSLRTPVLEGISANQ